ncbi:MAG: hypothetical protein E6K80_05090 [Candidatus Eisenbacteria bacterium]|uniref:Porin family protein n=1 Tax=Eiseniibacteriota bacterium TaxID=2212470 RepID=A0A538U6T1_UNCEI|nr:MAG: hypothetical protein E6K80_05090 [Candidatus Eisenbacteria bacterium]
MKRTWWVFAMSMALVMNVAGVARAKMGPGDAQHNRGGPGFHSVEAPIGIRWWLGSEKVGLDLGFGVTNEPSAIDPSENVTGWAIEAGLPLVCHSWERVHFLVRPGILYQSQEVGFDADPAPGIQFDTETTSSFDVKLEGEAEVFLASNLSVSAAHGLRFRSVDPGFGADRETSFATTGNNFTTIGFHVYIFQ